MFFSFLAYLIPLWLKIIPETVLMNFWIFLLFFSEFSCPGRVWTKLGTKIFLFLFFGLSHPVFCKSNVGKRFYNFLNFLLFFSEFSCPGRVWTELGTKIFFFPFFGLSHPVFGKNNVGKRFYNFLNCFYYFFRNFLARVEYERN